MRDEDQTDGPELTGDGEAADGSGKSSLEKALSIFDMFEQGRFALTLEEIAAEMDVAVPSCYRYLKVLSDAGFIIQSTTGAYTIGPRISLLEYQMRSNDPLIAEAAPFANKLVGAYPGTAHVTRAYRDELVCIYRCKSEGDTRDMFHRGRAMPKVRGAHAGILQAFTSRYRLKKLYEENTEEFAALPYGGTFSDLNAALARVRREKVSMEIGTHRPDSVGICAPILSDQKLLLGSLSFTFEIGAVDNQDYEALKNAVAAYGQDISARMAEVSPKDA